MKKYFGVMAAAAFAVLFMASCKSSESAYKKAYEKAKLQQGATASSTTTTVVPVEQVAPVTTPVTTVPVTQVATGTNDTDVRTIKGGVTVLGGGSISEYSVVVGSFSVQANAEGLQSTLRNRGYSSAQVLRTTETISGITGWYRVVATTFATKAEAVSSRNSLRATYPDAWLLYNK